MFFFAGGVSPKMKEVGHVNNLVCPACGAYTRLNVLKGYTCAHIFFIPVFKWGVSYIARCNSCDTIFRLNVDKGRAFEKGEGPSIELGDLEPDVMAGAGPICQSCKRRAEPGHSYCPYCGERL